MEGKYDEAAHLPLVSSSAHVPAVIGEANKKRDDFRAMLTGCELIKPLKDPLLEYFDSPSEENFLIIRSKVKWLLEMRSAMHKNNSFSQSESVLSKISLFCAVVENCGTQLQRQQLNMLEVVRQALLDLANIHAKLSLEDLLSIVIKWDEWLFSALPPSLRVDSYDKNRPESLCGLLSCLLIGNAVKSCDEFDGWVVELRTVALDLLLRKGKRLCLKPWLDDRLFKKSGFDWRGHRDLQNQRWGYTFSMAELSKIFEFDLPVFSELVKIERIEEYFGELRSADYLKNTEEKDIRAIMANMELIGDAIASGVCPQKNRHWREHVMSSMMFYMGVVQLIEKPQWAIEVSAQSKVRSSIIVKIKELEEKLLIGVNAKKQARHVWSKDARNLKKLKIYRESVKKEFQAIADDDVSSDNKKISRSEKLDALSTKMCFFVKEFLTLLIDSSIADLGDPPCVYAFIGFGSLEKNAVTPYSDIEFGILIENDTEFNREYFRNLTYLVQAKVIQLGETPIPRSLFDYSFDHLVSSGFCFDLGGKISLGRYYDESPPSGKQQGSLKYELIGSPENLIRYIEDSYFAVDKLLPVELSQCTHVAGDVGVTARYKKLLADRFDGINADNRRFCQVRAINLLVGNQYLLGDLQQFNVSFEVIDDEKLYDIKREIYRLPDRLIGDLALFYGILEGSAANKIRRLEKMAAISHEGANNLMIIDGIAKELRLRAYFYYGHQQEGLSVMPLVFKSEQSLYRTGNLESFQRYYETACPLIMEMRKFVGLWQNSFESMGGFFKNKTFRDTSPKLRIQIAQKLGQNDKVRILAQQMSKLDPKNPDLLGELGGSYLASNECHKAVECYSKQVKILEKQYGAKHFIVATALTCLGNAHHGLGQWHKQVELQERALVIVKKYYQQEQLALARILDSLACVYDLLGECDKQRDYIENALVIIESHYGAETIHVAEFLVALAKASRMLENKNKPIELLERALLIQKRHYGPEHPIVAGVLFDLGNAYGQKNDWLTAKPLQENALAIYQCHYPADHIDVVHMKRVLAYTYGALGDPKRHISIAGNIVPVLITHYGPIHPKIAATLSELSDAYSAIGDVESQVKLLEQAAAIEERYYGKGHPALEFTLEKLWGAYDELDPEEESASLSGSIN
jgi:tetratricopeptide (TPR) repeat protein